MSKEFSAGTIDHIEIFVPDRDQASSWYEEVLGLRVMEEHRSWATSGGPLMISGDGGRTMLALFQGEPLGQRLPSGLRRVAFRVKGPDFLDFRDRVTEFPVYDENGLELRSLEVLDHDKAFSVYFCDPFGNRLEITTYDYDYVRDRRGGGGSE